MTTETYDVVVIGGGAAGLAGAVALARSRRSVLVVDAGEPRNAPARGVHNYLGREGVAPHDLYAAGRAEAAAYGAQVRVGRVTSAARWPEGERGTGFDLEVDGVRVSARRLLLASGSVDELPDLPGLAARWGRDVLHCPFCHGWEVRDRAIGVLATGAMSAHQALMFRQLSDDVTLFLHGATPVSETDLTRLAARGVRVVPEAVTDVVVAEDRLVGLRLATGEVVARDALVVATVVVARSEVAAMLGLAAEPIEVNGQLVGTAVPADPTGRTPVPGLFAAGNVTSPMAQVVVSAAAGLGAGAMINADLIEEETADAVTRMQAAS